MSWPSWVWCLRVLFAETSKVVVDFLFNLLCLPTGTVVLLSVNAG